MPFEPPTEYQVHVVMEIQDELRRGHLLGLGSEHAPFVYYGLPGGELRIIRFDATVP